MRSCVPTSLSQPAERQHVASANLWPSLHFSLASLVSRLLLSSAMGMGRLQRLSIRKSCSLPPLSDYADVEGHPFRGKRIHLELDYLIL